MRGAFGGGLVLGLVLVGCSADDTGGSGVGVAGRVDASLPPGSYVHARTFDGRPAGETIADSDRFSLRIQAPPDVSRVVVAAIDAQDQNHQLVTVVDLDTESRSVFRDATAIELTPETTATVTALVASGDEAIDLDVLREHAGPEIADLAREIAASGVPVCRAQRLPDSTKAAVTSVVDRVPDGDRAAPLLAALAEVAEGVPADPSDQALFNAVRDMQAIVSDNVWSLNRLPAERANAVGQMLVSFPGILASRLLISAVTDETFAEITENPISQTSLDRIARTIALIPAGNCREKAFMGAYVARLFGAFKQVAVVPGLLQGYGEHAFAIGCREGPEVFDLQTFAVVDGEFQVPAADVEAARCIAIDPWFGPPEDPLGGQTAWLTPEFVPDFVEIWRPKMVLDDPPLDLPDPPPPGRSVCGEDGAGCGPIRITFGGKPSDLPTVPLTTPTCPAQFPGWTRVQLPDGGGVTDAPVAWELVEQTPVVVIQEADVFGNVPDYRDWSTECVYDCLSCGAGGGQTRVEIRWQSYDVTRYGIELPLEHRNACSFTGTDGNRPSIGPFWSHTHLVSVRLNNSEVLEWWYDYRNPWFEQLLGHVEGHAALCPVED